MSAVIIKNNINVRESAGEHLKNCYNRHRNTLTHQLPKLPNHNHSIKDLQVDQS